MAPNPFVPTFGRDPHILVGRREMLQSFEEAFEPGGFGPARLSLITGQRGVGKTVLLNHLQRAAEAQSWVVIPESSRPGLLDRLTKSRLPALLEETSGLADRPPSRSRLKSFKANIMGNGVEAGWEPRPEAAADLYAQMSELTQRCQRHGTGILLTLDEVQNADLTEMGHLGDVVQLIAREDQPIGFGAAGLKTYIGDLLDERGASFLRRAERFNLGHVDDLDEIAVAIQTTVHDGGKNMSDEAAYEAAEATRGYPYMIQLVGYEAWRQTGSRSEITRQDVARASEQAQRKLGQQIHIPALHNLSDIDKSYLMAMTLDDGPSRTQAVADRLGVPANYASTYRQRLINAGVIEEAGRGRVEFTLPYLREHLINEGASDFLRHTRPTAEKPLTLAERLAAKRAELDLPPRRSTDQTPSSQSQAVDAVPELAELVSRARTAYPSAHSRPSQDTHSPNTPDRSRPDRGRGSGRP